ncbi:hypothetical protein [Leisingera sp. S232]|uniref:hypothetical protein n=1 Tax=Leisingera sp. S232 TaxID=3415132 RepID=UPI000AF449E7
MRRSVTIPAGAALLALLSACGPLPVYYKQGVQVSRLQSDELACATQALKDAPVANQIRQHPPVFYPGGKVCHGGGCYYRPGYWVDGGIYTVDVNKPLRGRLEKSCMASKGYQQISLKRCTQNSAVASAGPQLPALSDAACAQRNRDGSVVIRTGG